MNVWELKQVLGGCTRCSIGSREFETPEKIPRFFDRMEVSCVEATASDQIEITLEGHEDEEEDE